MLCGFVYFSPAYYAVLPKIILEGIGLGMVLILGCAVGIRNGACVHPSEEKLKSLGQSYIVSKTAIRQMRESLVQIQRNAKNLTV